MPFDGVELPAVAKALLDAKELLIKEGWCRDVCYNTFTGARCLVGAVYRTNAYKDEANDPATVDAWNLLIEEVGDFSYANSRKCQKNPMMETGPVAFNNAQESVEPVLDLLDRAIARALR